MKLSILIPTLPERRPLFYTLWKKLGQQKIVWESTLNSSKTAIEILADTSGRWCSIGEKRNDLLNRAIGEYLCFIDDDDDIASNYIQLLMSSIEQKPDCISLKGEYSVDGIFDGIFEHSLKYTEWKNDLSGEIKYERNPNHLNCIKASIAKQFKFPEINFGEDHDWSKQLQASGLLKTEVHIPEILYYYKYKSKK